MNRETWTTAEILLLLRDAPAFMSILFTVGAQFTEDGINNTRNSHL